MLLLHNLYTAVVPDNDHGRISKEEEPQPLCSHTPQAQPDHHQPFPSQPALLDDKVPEYVILCSVCTPYIYYINSSNYINYVYYILILRRIDGVQTIDHVSVVVCIVILA